MNDICVATDVSPTIKSQIYSCKEVNYFDLNTVLGRGKYGQVKLILIDEEVYALKMIAKTSIDNPKRVKHV